MKQIRYSIWKKNLTILNNGIPVSNLKSTTSHKGVDLEKRFTRTSKTLKACQKILFAIGRYEQGKRVVISTDLKQELRGFSACYLRWDLIHRSSGTAPLVCLKKSIIAFARMLQTNSALYLCAKALGFTAPFEKSFKVIN